MQDSEVIKLVKPVPSDKLAIQVLVMWYNAVRPKWKKPLDLTITGFFVLMTLYSFSLRPLPPLYYQEKDYVFHEDYLTFSSEGVDPLNIPYDRFTTLCRTRQALLFLFGKKLVLWLPLHIMSAEEMESILNRFRNHGVEVKELY